jgi:hypothetical protein
MQCIVHWLLSTVRLRDAFSGVAKVQHEKAAWRRRYRRSLSSRKCDVLRRDALRLRAASCWRCAKFSRASEMRDPQGVRGSMSNQALA